LPFTPRREKKDNGGIMTRYRCFNCGKIVEVDTTKTGFKCPECGGKVFFMLRPTVAKKVKAR
jgi:DNA-directed RNA polymerase subunit RPC12/RpoP